MLMKIENIVMLINKYKLVCREVDGNIENELIRTCLENNHDFVMISQHGYICRYDLMF
jgi:hypothetical protein